MFRRSLKLSRNSPVKFISCFSDGKNRFQNGGKEGDISSFHIVAQEYGHSGRPLPTFSCSKPNNVQFNNPATVTCRDLSSYVPNAFQLLNILSPDECSQIIKHLDNLGWDEDAPVSLPHSFRHMENVNWLAHDTIVNQIWNRAKNQLPNFAQSVAMDADAVGLNARFRCYKYQGGDYFKPHTDGSWPGSGLSKDGKSLIWDRYPGDRWSQYTFLLLLSDGYDGGRTIFYPTKDQIVKVPSVVPAELDGVINIDNEMVQVRTPLGAALCFPHGGHPDHAKHAGEIVAKFMKGDDEGTTRSKIMIRTEILYKRTEESDALQKDWFRSGSGQ